MSTDSAPVDLAAAGPFVERHSFRAELHRCSFDLETVRNQAAAWVDAALDGLDPTEISPRARQRIADAHRAALIKATTDQLPKPAVFNGWTPSPLQVCRDMREMIARTLIHGKPSIPIWGRLDVHSIEDIPDQIVGRAYNPEYFPAVSNTATLRNDEFVAFEVESTPDLRRAALEWVKERGLVMLRPGVV